MAQISRACRKKMAPWPPRPVLVLVLLLALLCSSADSGKPKSKAPGGRKALVAAASVDDDDDDDGEDAPPVVKPAKKAASAAGKIKKRVDIDAKNQTTKAKKAESAAAAKGATKKASSKAGGDGAVSKAKLLEADKAKAKGTDSAKAAKVSKSSGAGKAAKSEAATAASVALLLLPLCVLTALVRRAGAYLPLLHRALLLAQAYLAVYFATLAVAAAATGLEPLRFFRAASPGTYAWTQAAQSLGFMAYLVLQMVDLVAVFSGAAAPQEDGEAARALGLAQMVVGLAVGLHYYAAVFHRAAADEAPPRQLARLRSLRRLLRHHLRLRARRAEEEGLPRPRRRRGVEEELSRGACV